MILSNRILLITSNEETARSLIERLLMVEHYSVNVERSAADGLKNFKDSGADLVILEWNLPDMECGQFLRELRRLDADIPLLVIFDDSKSDQVLQLGEVTYCQLISKSLSAPALTFNVQKGLEMRQALLANKRLVSILKEQHAGLQKQNLLLVRRVEETAKNLSRLYEDLRTTYLRTIRALAQAIDARDHYTHKHSENVSRYSILIAKVLEFPIKEVETLREAAELHDIGKIGISDLILLKTSSLTKEEWEMIKKHPQTGAQILEPLTFLTDVIELVRQHHEHFNGSGYPAGLVGDAILLGARILHVADAYDSMISPRSYRPIPLSREQACAELERNRDTQFDPNVVDAFLKIVNELQEA
jgi:putative two-component system response regulator